MSLPPAAPPPIILRTGPVMLAGKSVLAPMDLTLAEMRIGILGRNGSGKTTFLRLVAGLLRAQSGAVSCAGADPYQDRASALRQIGILFQNPDQQILFPTVGEELAFGLIQQGARPAEAAQRVRRLLEQEGRSHWFEAQTASLSGGQKQYLCLLAILAMAPQTLLLDEPFSGLDLPAQLRLSRRLAALPQRLIVISHDPAQLRLCDRLIWLEAGALQADGPSDSVLPAYLAQMTQLGARDADLDLAD